MNKKIAILIFILLIVIIVGWLQFKDSYMGAINTMEITMVNSKDLYNDNCSSCHMENLAGNFKWKSSLDVDGQRLPPPLNGTGHTWHHSPKQLFEIIRYGYKKVDPDYQGKMLGNENLTNDEIWSILKYIKGKWPEKIRAKYHSSFSE